MLRNGAAAAHDSGHEGIDIQAVDDLVRVHVRLGLVRPGYLADLLIVDGNPAENLRYLYPFGAIRKNEDHSMYRTEGIVYTIKDGVVVDNAKVMEEVARMVAESKAEAGPDIVNSPFLPFPQWMSRPGGGRDDSSRRR